MVLVQTGRSSHPRAGTAAACGAGPQQALRTAGRTRIVRGSARSGASGILGKCSPPAPRILAVSGLMGSGKSTLTRGIARIMGYRYLPEDMLATRYLSDLSRDPGRWAFETQLAFLCHRSVGFWTALNDNYAVVLDRTLSEDVNIFAKCFQAEGYMDQRAYDTYMSLARYFLLELPPPDLVLHCQCSMATALKRISERQRPDRLLHGEQHLRNIAAYYEEWLATYRDSTIYILDSNAIDWRDPAVLQTIAQEIYNIRGLPTPPAQADLFAPVEVPPAKHDGAILKPHFLKLPERGWTERIPRRDTARVPLYPFAYLAAPFTGRAVTQRPSATGTLFVESNAHGRILRGPYRTMLLGVEKVLSGFGLKTLLPHRDVNSWGNVTRESEEVTQLCTEHVSRCDLFVGILGGAGSHYELAWQGGSASPQSLSTARNWPTPSSHLESRRATPLLW